MGGGTRKPFLMLDGLPLLAHTLHRLSTARGCEGIILAVHPEDYEPCRTRWLEALRREFSVREVVPGGRRRQDSVRAALRAAPYQPEVVLIHDAVRPLVRCDVIMRTACAAWRLGAAIAAVPAVVTVKEVDAEGRIVATPPRERLRMAQTPQAFRLPLITRAHERARRDGFTGTDDAQLVERLGESVHVVEDSPDNIKITTPEDLAVAEAILHWQRDQGLVEARPRSMDETALPGMQA